MGRPILEDKLCSGCKERKPKDEFYGIKRKCGTCKSCQKQSQINRRIFINDYLSDKNCVDCGESNPIVLDFDHRKNKTMDISRMIRNNVSKDRLLTEIQKCDIRCCNCHRIRTAKQFNWPYRGK